jgi:hypothetical protein
VQQGFFIVDDKDEHVGSPDTNAVYPYPFGCYHTARSKTSQKEGKMQKKPEKSRSKDDAAPSDPIIEFVKKAF